MRAYGLSASHPQGWDVLAIVDGREVIGAVITKGDEAHIGVTRTANIRSVLKEVIGGQLAMYGQSTTTVRKTNAKGQRFVERIGYVKSHESGELIHYVLKEFRYA